jgi:ATP synthase F1 delta subunit
VSRLRYLDSYALYCNDPSSYKKKKKILESQYFSDRKDSMKSPSLPRYAMALFNAAKPTGKLEKVFNDLFHIRNLASTETSFKLFLETPGIKKDQKQNVVSDICKATKADDLTKNFLNVLLENQRLVNLVDIVNSFEDLYRKDLGQVICTVSSAVELTNAQRKLVEESLSQRMTGKKLVVSYDVSPTILGGLVVKVDDVVLDYSVNSKVDRLRGQLLNPIS